MANSKSVGAYGPTLFFTIKQQQTTLPYMYHLSPAPIPVVELWYCGWLYTVINVSLDFLSLSKLSIISYCVYVLCCNINAGPNSKKLDLVHVVHDWSQSRAFFYSSFWTCQWNHKQLIVIILMFSYLWCLPWLLHTATFLRPITVHAIDTNTVIIQIRLSGSYLKCLKCILQMHAQ